MNKDRVWSFSTIDTFLKCKKKHYYRKVMGLTPKTVAPALDFGKALHIGLDVYYSNIKNGVPSTDAMKLGIEKFATSYVDRPEDDKRTVSNGVKVLQCYEETYKQEPFEVIQVETSFAIDIGGILYGGRLDALIRWSRVLYVMEHKSTTVLGMNYFKQFENSTQLDGYTVAASDVIGERCAGVLVNALEVWKDPIKVTAKTKSMQDHFARDPQTRTEKELKEFKEDVIKHVADIERCEATNCFPRTKSACFTYNYKCPYFDLCKYGEDERLIARDFDRVTPDKVESEEPNAD